MTHDELIAKHPKILGKVALEHGEGWYPLIDRLCTFLQWHTDKNEYKQIVASQVKEKFGTLRFYTNYDEEGKQAAAIEFAEFLSGSICDVCGAPGKARQGGGIVTRCDEHASK